LTVAFPVREPEVPETEKEKDDAMAELLAVRVR
jgi:hypothetical protein